MSEKGRAGMTSPADDIQIVRGALWAAFPPRQSPRYTEAHRTVEAEATAALDRLEKIVGGSNSSTAPKEEGEVIGRIGKLLGRKDKPETVEPVPAVLPKGTWTRERIIEAVQEWAAEHDGVPPSADNWKRRSEDGRYPPITAATGKKKPFKSWNEMIEAAGFTPRLQGYPDRPNVSPPGKRKWPRERIIAAIQLWAAEHDGEPPKADEWKAHSDDERFPSHGLVFGPKNPFKNWNEAIAAAGFTPRKQGGNRKPIKPKADKPAPVVEPVDPHQRMTDPRVIAQRDREVELAKKMRSYGQSVETIAATFRVHPTTVKKWLGE